MGHDAPYQRLHRRQLGGHIQLHPPVHQHEAPYLMVCLYGKVNPSVMHILYMSLCIHEWDMSLRFLIVWDRSSFHRSYPIYRIQIERSNYICNYALASDVLPRSSPSPDKSACSSGQHQLKWNILFGDPANSLREHKDQVSSYFTQLLPSLGGAASLYTGFLPLLELDIEYDISLYTILWYDRLW